MPYNAKDETVKHFVVKCLFYKVIAELGHKSALEHQASEHCTFDVIDLTTGLVYEVQGDTNPKIVKAKIEKYMKISGVRDVIIVPLERFNINSPVKKWYEMVKAMVV